MKKDVVVYPAVFKQDESDVLVRVPDINAELGGVLTQGANQADAVVMAEDAIGIMLEDMLVYPTPSLPTQITLSADEYLVYISVDMLAYKRMHTKYVRRNITLPEWLNKQAKAADINVSKIATEAIATELAKIQ